MLDDLPFEYEAYLPTDPPDHRPMLRRVAWNLLDYYRTMDPLVAQFWAGPGIAPVAVDDAGPEAAAS